jgi:hypothetical protein
MGKNCDTVESNAIILNATGGTLNATTSGSVFVAPMRNVDESGFQVLARNAATGEIIQTLVDASTGFLPSSWSLYPAVSAVDISGFDITNVSQGTFQSIVLNSTEIALGLSAGITGQGANAVAIGLNAGQSNQSSSCVAIGVGAGLSGQTASAIAIGNSAGSSAQGANAIAIGGFAGAISQGADSIAIGNSTGYSFVGQNSIAIGRVSSAQFSNAVVLNATGGVVAAAQANSCYIAPLRAVQDSNAYQNSLMTYDTTTKEVGYATNAYSIQVVATSGTAIALDPTLRGKTFILTGTTTQAFSTTALGANDTNFFVVVHNGNAVNGGDVNLTGMTGTNVLHERTTQRNNGTAYLYWDGTTLTGY